MRCRECGEDMEHNECPNCGYEQDPGSLADIEYDARTDAAYDEVKEERIERLR